MKTKVWKFYANYEKEEKWLNEMGAKGLHLSGYTFGRYIFEKGTPGEFVYRIELLKELPSHPESKAYIEFLEDNGIECVASHIRWVFLRKKASEGVFDLYTDNESKMAYFQRLVTFYSFLSAFNLLFLFLNVNNGLLLEQYYISYVSLIHLVLFFIITPLLLSYLRKIRKLKKEIQLYQ